MPGRLEPTEQTNPDDEARAGTAHGSGPEPAADVREREERGVPHTPEDDTDAKGAPSGDRLETETASGRPDAGGTGDERAKGGA